ncbi:mitochondrial import inner membrane translocase subunit TIM17-2-like [Solanum stenotomum]|uniref:mitochondrial import inner membrane translocase subunit TIM17-2-like n=1 Tax=Solanum stenotomum TaxID=172797 RepID=UPI0020D1A2A0|nr:mitochondrial import inner membrane translocase subunit TIM17-2-like [Solanum stenotomum]
MPLPLRQGQFIKSNQSLPWKVKAGLLCWCHTFNLFLPSQCLSPVTMGTPETSREPCPDRILDDVGGAFGMGAVGGSAFHFLKGIYNSPKGERLIGGTQAVRMNAPRIGGSFAVWGGLFSSFDCTMVYLRQKEDPWNSIIAGAATGGFLQMRQGLGAASRSALFGGVLLALIEGAGIMLNKVMSAPQNFPPMEDPLPNVPGVPGYPPGQLPGQPTGQLPGQAPVSIDGMMAESSAPSSSSWFGGLFGGGKKEETATGGGSKTQVLESFDAPVPPTFEFK